MAVLSNKIVIGDDINNPILTFDNATVREIHSETAVSMIGDELFIDQFVPVLEYEVWIPRVFKPTDAKGVMSKDGKILCSRQNYDLRTLPYGTKITYYHNNQPGGEFFCKRVERVGKTQYKLSGISAIGLMDKQFHKGGLYRGEYVGDVIHEITGPEYDYVIDNAVAKQRVFGWLPYDTRRKNLHQLLIAYGINIVKGDNGKMFFTFLESGQPETIPSRRVFTGGSVVYDEPASRLEVTEHGYHYIDDIDEEVLFDNTNDEAVEDSLITFDMPINPDTLYVELQEGEEEAQLIIHSCGVNYAYVTGIGVLKGKPYYHSSRVLTVDNENAQVERVVKVEEATLISVMNSQQCLERLASYYFHAITVKEDIQIEEEKAGKQYIVNNVYNEQLTGFISKISTGYSSFRRGTCDIIQNYDPNGLAPSYTESVIIPLDEGDDVTWQIPAQVFEHEKPTVRVILIGHGYPGEYGSDGAIGPYFWDHEAEGGAGGAGGLGGRGGRVLIVTLDVEHVTSIRLFNYENDSVLQVEDETYTSYDGASRTHGYYDPFTDTAYGVRGEDGMHGGRGGDGDFYTHNSSHENTATPGEDVVYKGIRYTGGATARRSDAWGNYLGISDNLHVYISGRGGGGAAAGQNGGDAPEPRNVKDRNPGGYNGYFGVGGEGASPPPAPPPVNNYGNGGNGGHGGGGGGAIAIREYWNWLYSVLIATDGTGETPGGKGGAPSEGLHGCAIIYY